MQPNTYCHGVPVDWDNPHQIKLRIRDGAKDELRRLEPRQSLTFIRAFDHISRKWFAIRHFPCWRDSDDCYCAAQAMQIDGPNADVNFPPVPPAGERAAEMEAEEAEQEREEQEERERREEEEEEEEEDENN